MPSSKTQSDLALLRSADESFFRRADAVRRLARCDEDEAHQAVLAALQDKEPYVRRAAADGLAHQPQPDDLDPILKAFADNVDEQVQRALVKALASFADPQALETVEKVAESGSYGLRYDAQSAVSQIKRNMLEQAGPAAEENDIPATEPTPLRPPPEPKAEPQPEPAPGPAPEPPVEPPTAAAPEPAPIPAPEPAEPAQEEKPREPSAGVLDFRSFALPERLLWVPAALWPALLLLVWANGIRSETWWAQILALALVLWRRGVQFDGFTKCFWRWNGVVVPLSKRLADYEGMTGIEVRERPSHLAEILPENYRKYMRLELGRHEVVLLHEREGDVRLKCFRNLAAALVAAQQAAEFLALPIKVNQETKGD